MCRTTASGCLSTSSSLTAGWHSSHSRGYIPNPRFALAELPLALCSQPRLQEAGAGAGPRPTWPGARLGGTKIAPPRPRPRPGDPLSPPAGPGGRSQVFAGARMSELWLRSGSGSLRSLRAGLPAHPEPRGAPAALPAARPPGSQPPGFGGGVPGHPHPAELLTRSLSRCPQLRSDRDGLDAPPPRFLPRQFCPGRAAALIAPRSFLPSFFSGNLHSSSACDVPRTRPLRPSECGPPAHRGPPGRFRPPPDLPPNSARLFLSLISGFTPSLAFNCSLVISPVKGGGPFKVVRMREVHKKRLRTAIAPDESSSKHVRFLTQ
ncbi:unnamed protein product [Rangifer tarandus platyrhynchus]|uniref:Uncharacterized protein n=1 Tax=Rangifer tarandus platyrhynchus TaxID=3082113 RepID=A0AC59Z5M1_RANTA